MNIPAVALFFDGLLESYCFKPCYLVRVLTICFEYTFEYLHGLFGTEEMNELVVNRMPATLLHIVAIPLFIKIAIFDSCYNGVSPAVAVHFHVNLLFPLDHDPCICFFSHSSSSYNHTHYPSLPLPSSPRRCLFFNLRCVFLSCVLY